MANPNSLQADPLQQKLLPQVRIAWYFLAITAAALLLMLVRWAGEGQALLVSMLSILGWILGLFSLFSLLFLITYWLGVLETILAPPENEVLSPFASERLPEQIVTPVHVDDK